VRGLDPGSRALLDLSLRHRVRDDDMAVVLRVDAFQVAWLRARAIERVASELGAEDPIGIGAVRAALPRVGEGVWMQSDPGGSLPAPASPAHLVPVPHAPVARYVAPPHAPFSDKLRSAAMAGRSVARGAPHPPRPALKAALLTGAGAVLGFTLVRRRRR